jgi:outer membrane receptor protein involved in Fe transport
MVVALLIWAGAMGMGWGHAEAQESAGTGAVAGTVLDEWHDRPLAGVVVSVRGTTLAVATGNDGRYLLEGVEVGERVVAFSKSGYARAIVTEVRVGPGQTSTVNIRLRPEFYEMEEYEVSAETIENQTAELFFERQSAISMTDAIGSDMFKNLAVGDAAQALSKVTGATVADGKYAVIRGLADRYTFTTMNGLELPSADPDRKAFQLDLMPAKFIDQLDVYKTFTPDMSGGFAGGSVDIVTKSFPEDFLFEFRIGAAYNTESSLRDDFPGSDGGSTDWLGFDDGIRALPDEVAATNPSGSQNFPDAAKASFESSQFAPVQMDSLVDLGGDFLVGDTVEVFGKRLGFLAGYNYKNEYRYTESTVKAYDGGGAVTVIDKEVISGTIDYQWGALVNLALELSEDHDLKFDYLRVQSASDEASRGTGQQGDTTSVADGTYMDQSVLNWTERSLSYYQLAGEHRFPELEDIQFKWGGAYSLTTQEDPDFRVFQFFADPRSSSYNPNLTASQPNSPTRYWRDLEEENMSLRGDLTIPVPSYNDKENFVKTGVALNLSEREYFQRGISALGTSAHPFNRVGDPNMWMASTNLQHINVRNFPANATYDGEQEIRAAYLMGDWAAFNWLRVVGGIRFESTDLTVDTLNLTQNRPLPTGQLQQDDWMPALSLTYQPREDLEFRGSWSRTVVRPTYREIAPVAIYDVFKGRNVLGNPNLQMAESENYDFRASWYPRPGELVSVGVFAKRIDQPIELSALTTDYSQIRYDNFDQADVYGIEAELLLKLDRIWEPLEVLSLGFNFAYIESEVPLTDVQLLNRRGYGDFSTTRSLYDQPDYILNSNLTWDNPATGTTVTLSGGVVGESLVLVGLSRPDEFVQPAPELNLFIRQKLGKHWDVRFTARNLLNPEYEISQTWPVAGETTLESYTKGITFGLSVGCEF